MKNVLPIVLLCVFSISTAQESEQSKRQIEQGTFRLGGSFSISARNNNFNSSQRTENETFTLYIAPNFGYAINTNLILGASLGYVYSKSESMRVSPSGFDDQSSENTQNGYFFTPYIRHYFSITNKFMLFAQGEAGIGYRKGEFVDEFFSSTPQEFNSTSYSIGVRPGLTFFFSDKLAMESSFGFLGYNRIESENEANDFSEENSSDTSNFRFDLNTSNLFFGLSYYF